MFISIQYLQKVNIQQTCKENNEYKNIKGYLNVIKITKYGK